MEIHRTIRHAMKYKELLGKLIGAAREYSEEPPKEMVTDHCSDGSLWKSTEDALPLPRSLGFARNHCPMPASRQNPKMVASKDLVVAEGRTSPIDLQEYARGVLAAFCASFPM